MDTMNSLSSLPEDFDGKVKVNHWYETLSSMKASDELTDEQVRQMLFDLEQAYNSFNRSLQHT